MNEIMQYVTFCVWLLLLCVFLRFICIAAFISISFLLMGEYYSIVWLYRMYLGILQLVDTWLLPPFGFVKNALMNLGVQVSL